jgi:hypothetical protein
MQNGEKMKMFDSLVNVWTNIKNKISEMFQPTELSKLARKNKFIQRSTSLLQGKEFVDLMTAASIDPQVIPLEVLCSILREQNPEVDLAPQSLMERINRPESAAFLKTIFQKTLEKGMEDIIEKTPPELLARFDNVYIEDCTECTLNEELQDKFKGSSGGASKASVKIDLIYEIKRKNIFSIDLVDRRSPDQKLAKKHLDIIKNGDLWIRDLGFFDVTVLKIIAESGAYFLSRLHASANVYFNKEDESPLDLAEYLNRHYPNDAVIDLQVFVTAEKLPCRLVAYRAPKEIAEKRRRAANMEAKKKGRMQKEANKNRLDFTFFITNVPKDVWKADVVGTIYTVRWQIELIFKSWKSALKIHYLKGTNEYRIKCLLYGKLISIAVMNLIYKLADWHAQKIGREISLHKVINWLKVDNKLAVIVLKGFSWKLFNLLMREVSKTLCKDKRKRKTTEDALNEGIHYCDLYNPLKVEIHENQSVSAA